MTYAEALDMAARAAGWRDWENAVPKTRELSSISAHAKTIMENAALEAKLADVSKALMATAGAAASSAKKAVEAEARLAVAREALEEIADVGDDVDCSDCKASGVSARAALKEIDNGDR